MKFSPKSLKRLLNLYPPYLGAGVKITHISEDWRELHVGMSLRWYNRNAVNTHFGGSLYSMIDPHLMLLLMQILGKEYLVWDKAADIEFIKASKKKVRTVIKITDKNLEDITLMTKAGKKYFPEFMLDVIDEDNELVARVKKTIYVKKKKSHEQVPVNELNEAA
jgi:acyl-coenzyme A thioesterase PaaI-like protein